MNLGSPQSYLISDMYQANINLYMLATRGMTLPKVIKDDGQSIIARLVDDSLKNHS